MNIKLTEEQEAIKNHNFGPAIVFAVAGSGKTISMVHRIKRLIDDKLVEPKNILACSFGKKTVSDIKENLLELDVKNVSTKTLHSLGLEV